MPEESSTIVIYGTVLINRNLVPDAVVIVRDGRITAAGRSSEVSVPSGSQLIDARHHFVVPGFIDIHIHGSGGCRAEDDAPGMARHIIRNGTTWFLPTLISNDFDRMLVSIDHVRSCVGRVQGGASIGGIHLEGPFLNPKYGAQRPETNIEPDRELVRMLIERCETSLRLVTIAPERRGAIDAIRAFRAAGATVSVGHTDANEEEYRAGRMAGVTHATHLFNAMPSRIWPNVQTYAGAKAIGIEELILADDGISADMMCDATSAHVHPSLLKIALKCKGAGKLSLITDAMVAAGLPCGEHRMFDGQTIFSRSGEDIARLADGRLCGSLMTMCGALRNLIKHTGVSLENALTMASEAPAHVVGLFEHKGSVAAGKDADLVLLDSELNVRSVLVGGEIVFGLEGLSPQ